MKYDNSDQNLDQRMNRERETDQASNLLFVKKYILPQGLSTQLLSSSHEVSRKITMVNIYT